MNLSFFSTSFEKLFAEITDNDLELSDINTNTLYFMVMIEKRLSISLKII